MAPDDLGYGDQPTSLDDVVAAVSSIEDRLGGELEIIRQRIEDLQEQHKTISDGLDWKFVGIDGRLERLNQIVFTVALLLAFIAFLLWR